VRSFTFLFVFLATFSVYARDAREFDVRPAPAWVERLDVPADVAVAKANVRWGIYDILSDHQVRAGNGRDAEYFRTVRKVLSSSGVQNASELSLDFDPSFERLVIHDIVLVRDGKRSNALDAGSVRVIDKEDDSDDEIFDGERTALIFVKDVRAGDVLDYSWSVEGGNPILNGRYTDEYDLSSAVPARLVRHRLLWPEARPLHWRGGEPAVTKSGVDRVLVWQRENVPAIDVEDDLPSWYEPWSSVQVTDFGGWSEVAAWSDAMFRIDDRSAKAVKGVADGIRAAHATRDERITAAIRFVQDEIRYLGIEMGPNSHQPHQPWETLDARWGDCKDKTLLLVALLRELGLQAYPALVNTRLQQRLDEKLPSPFLFDHVITEVVDGGHTWWIDGTIADQGGTLATIETPSDSRALVVRAETTALTPVITNTRGATVIDQTYTTTAFDKPTALTVRSTYTGGDADDMRSTLATLSVEDLAHKRINRLASDQPKIKPNGVPVIHDDRLRNVIVITESYQVPDLWSDGHWTWYPRVLESHLDRPSTMIRSMPLAFDYPLDIRQNVTFNFPEEIQVEKSSTVTETPALRYEYVVDSNGKTVTIRQSLRAVRDAVPVKDVAEHLTKINEIWDNIGYRLAPDGARSLAGANVATSSASVIAPGTKWGLGLFIAAMFIGLALIVPRSRRQAAEQAVVAMSRPTFGPGDAPASAVTVAGTHEMEAHLAGRRCACGSNAYSTPDLQHARYGEGQMTIVTRHCGACGREQSLYFTA